MAAKVQETDQCDERGSRNYYRYYDSPDGCHMDKKIMVTTRYGVVVGLIAGTYDIMMYSHVVGLGPMLWRYARHIVPLAGMGATFAAVANSVQRLRNVDDSLNYFLGGLACGPLLALYTRSGHGVVAGGILLGIIGVLKKDSVDTGYSFFPDIPRHMNTIGGWRNDWTLARDPRDDMKHTCDQESKGKKGKKDN